MNYSIEFDNKEVPPNKRLSEIPFKEKPIVTFRIEQYVEDQDGRNGGNTLHLITPDMIQYVTLSKGERRHIAIKRHQEETAQLLKQAIERLRDE